MKIRNGFVSNSSSSSFIIDINNSKFKTVKDVAKHMLNKLSNDYADKYIKNLDKLKENDPVHFPSCNYDTFITKAGNNILISTCNNEDWDIDENGKLCNEAISKIKDIEEQDEYYDEDYSLDFDNKYLHEEISWYIKSIGYFHSLLYEGLYARESNNFGELCKKNTNPLCSSYTNIWVTPSGEKVCPYCDKETYLRKLKLENIKKSIKA